MWYQHDFGGTDPGVIDHLQRYARPELAAALVLIDRISGDRYDWGLNDLK